MASQALVGQVLDGKYSIEKPLGKGGMGTVYLATHIGTGRPVAVKVIAPDFMERAEFVERFRREAQAAGRLRHPNVVDVTDFGFSGTTEGPEVAYLVMEYLDGCTLGEILDEEKQLPVAWTIDIIEQVCSAVEEAHRQGIIHRDLKPDNIWLEPNQRGGYTVKVLDFGIAKLEETQLANAAMGRYSDQPGRGETLVGEAQETLADNEGATVVEEGSRTLVSENETLALGNGNSDPELDFESARRKEVNLESGTAIMGSSDASSDPSIAGRGTVVEDGVQSTDRSDRTTPSTAALTRMGAVLGTPLYMSPEQCRGERLTSGSDIYSLAVIVYQMLSGRLPFEGNYVEVMEGHKHAAPPPLDAKKVKRKLRETVMTSLAKSPEDRPQSAEVFANKLRANSEGLGSLFTRALSIFGERIGKIMLLTVITFSVPIALNFLRVLINIGLSTDYLESSGLLMFVSGSLSLVTFFLQIIAVAMLIGMLTWLVGQILAYPLRPLSLRAAFREVRAHVKSLAGLVTLSSLIAAVGYVFLFVPGILLASRFMLIAPSVMMEGVRGRAAFRRSAELYKRARVTIIATASIIFLISAILPLSLGLSISAIVGNIDKSMQIERMKRDGVTPAAELEKQRSEAASPAKDDSDLNVSWNRKGISVGETGHEDEDPGLKFRASIIEATFELIWTPIHLVIIAFSSMVSALIYFKTRQAGGESMQDLLGKLNSANSPQSKWQERVNRRLIQSGRISSGSGTS
ncbi:MAG: serine/threonine protein kinase [Aridibacter famidurans]|nr:serine/threonine protein kinase [Aridibacter famidurans]